MRDLTVPTEVETAMVRGAAMVVSVSGGKDSQAVLAATAALCKARGWIDRLFVVHADLGRIEWEGTRAHVDRTCAEVGGVGAVVVSAGDLVDRWKRRMAKLAGTGKPFWSSAAQRYCTSDMKRNPIDKFLRGFNLVVSVDGVRAQESVARRKQPVLAVRTQITSTAYRQLEPAEALRAWSIDQSIDGQPARLAFNWHAIHGWSIDQVWEACGTSTAEIAHRRALFASGLTAQAFAGATVHHAYIRGNERLSCSICVLASDADIRNGARNNPVVARELLGMEADSGFTFKHNKSLATIIESVLATQEVA